MKKFIAGVVLLAATAAFASAPAKPAPKKEAPVVTFSKKVGHGFAAGMKGVAKFVSYPFRPKAHAAKK